jgi:hypothetical protein
VNHGPVVLLHQVIEADSSPAATRSMMAASLAGPVAAFKPAGFGPSPAVKPGPLPGPSCPGPGSPYLLEPHPRRKVAHFVHFPACFQALELPAARAVWLGVRPGPWPDFDPKGREDRMPGVRLPSRNAQPRAPIRQARTQAGKGRSAASPSGGKSAEWRIDLALQRIVGWRGFNRQQSHAPNWRQGWP